MRGCSRDRYGEWQRSRGREIDGAVRERLAGGLPEFSAALALPETRAGIDAPPVEIEVTNGDDIPRRFLGALNRTGPLIAYTPVARVSETVPAGETTTIEVDDGWAGTPGGDGVGDGDPDVRYRLQYGDEEVSASIRLVESDE